MKACTSGLIGSSMESKRGLLTPRESLEELERRWGVEDFLRELPLSRFGPVDPLLCVDCADVVNDVELCDSVSCQDKCL